MVKVGINGFGITGRHFLRSVQANTNIQVVGINDATSTVEEMAYLLKYDTINGKFHGTVEVKDGNLVINGNPIRVTSENYPADLKWNEVAAEYIVEATGNIFSKSSAQGHIDAGAKYVVLTTVPTDDTLMIVPGVNHYNYPAGTQFVSDASDTTNAIAPLAKVLNDKFGIKDALITSIHSMVRKQKVVDEVNLDNPRLGRAASANIIPVSDDSAKLTGKIIPELNGKLLGSLYHVPVLDCSAIEFTANLAKETSYTEICNAMSEATEGELAGILGYTEDEVVSSDFIGDSRLVIFDAKAGLQLTPTFIKIVGWYDNEWAKASKIANIIEYMVKVNG